MKTEPREVIEILPGAEVVVLVTDPRSGVSLWLRGRATGGSIVDRRPKLGPFEALESPTYIVEVPPFKLDLGVEFKTYTFGTPSPEQLAEPVPEEFDPAYFSFKRAGP